MFTVITSTFLCGCAEDSEVQNKYLPVLKVAGWMDFAVGIILLVLGALAATGHLPPVGVKIFFPLGVLSGLIGIGTLRGHCVLVERKERSEAISEGIANRIQKRKEIG